jgi:flagellar export protein FliJ
MKRSQRLGTLSRLAGMAEHAARLRLAQANQDLLRKQQQQRQLRDYDAEYAERWLEAGRDGVSGRRLVELGAFRSGLARTLAVQDAAVGGATELLQHEAGEWRRRRERLRVMEKLVDAARRREDYVAERRLQRVIDDLAGSRR